MLAIDILKERSDNLKKKLIPLLIISAILLVGCETDIPMSEEHIISSGGAYKTELTVIPEEVVDNVENSEDEVGKEVKVVEENNIETMPMKILSILQLELETETLDNDLEIIEANVHKVNGYVYTHKINESLDKKHLRQATMSVRIPKKDSKDFITNLKENFKIYKETSFTADATETYFDLETKLNSIDNQELQLLKMYEETNNIEDMLKINDRLAELSTEKAKLKADYSHMKERMKFTTIDIIINGKEDYLNLSLLSRIKEALSKIFTLANVLLVNILVGLVYLIPIILLGLLLTKHKLNKRKLENSKETINSEDNADSHIEDENLHNLKDK